MSGVNKVILVGRLGNDPELKTVGQGQVCNFSLATSESWVAKDGQKQEKTEWHRVQVWGKRAETVAKYLSKGKMAYVEGSIHTRQYDKDGVKMFATEIKAFQVQFLSPASEKSQPASHGPEEFGAEPTQELPYEEIPF